MSGSSCSSARPDPAPCALEPPAAGAGVAGVIPAGATLRVVGDVHGDARASRWRRRPTGSWCSSATSPMAARTAPARWRIALDLLESGRGLFLLGNHDHKLARLLSGRAVQAGRGAAGDRRAAGRRVCARARWRR